MVPMSMGDEDVVDARHALHRAGHAAEPGQEAGVGEVGVDEDGDAVEADQEAGVTQPDQHVIFPLEHFGVLDDLEPPGVIGLLLLLGIGGAHPAEELPPFGLLPLQFIHEHPIDDRIALPPLLDDGQIGSGAVLDHWPVTLLPSIKVGTDIPLEKERATPTADIGLYHLFQ